MNIHTVISGLCLLALPLAAAAAEPATSPFPDRPYLLQFKRDAAIASPIASAPGRGMTPSLSMGPGGTCNAEYTGDCTRVDIGGAGWADWGSFAATNYLGRVELHIKRAERKAALCAEDTLECRLYLIPSEVGTIDRVAPEPVLSFFGLTRKPKYQPLCVKSDRLRGVQDAATEITESAKSALASAGVKVIVRDTFDVKYRDGSIFRYEVTAINIDGSLRYIEEGSSVLPSDPQNSCR